jgi:hypothetical protein
MSWASAVGITLGLVAGPGSVPADGAAAGDPGQLVNYPLVYRAPSARAFGGGEYVVFFRTRERFQGHDEIGTTIPGRIDLEDSYDNHDGFFVFPGHQSQHCYFWSLAETPKLKRKRIGDPVRLRFRLHRTGTQRRTITLRKMPTDVHGIRDFRRRESLARRLRWIGCY